jgi:hypothetical protein
MNAKVNCFGQEIKRGKEKRNSSRLYLKEIGEPDIRRIKDICWIYSVNKFRRSGH